MCNKLCYAIGGAPYQITGTALGFFLQIYLLDVAQVIVKSYTEKMSNYIFWPHLLCKKNPI